MLPLFAQLAIINVVHSLSCTTTTYDATLGSQTLPRGDSGQAVEYDENTNTVLIVGGWEFKRQLVKFNPSSGTFDSGDTSHANFDITYGSAQQHATIGNTMWMINSLGTSFTTIHLQSPYTANNPNINIPTTVDYYGCLAAKEDYLFVIGGDADGMNKVQIYNTGTGGWLVGQTLQDKRGRSVCLTIKDTLYVIGGMSESGNKRYNTIEILDVSNLNLITSQQWTYFGATFSVGISEMRGVPYGDDIIIIGGRFSNDINSVTYTNKVHVIHTVPPSISVCGTLQGGESTGRIGFAPSIIVGNKLYVFAGYTYNDKEFDQYQYIYLPPTDNPTTAPTTHAPTSNPTPSPTNYPTPSPTNYPTPSPTNFPTPSPTNYPTPSPTNNPTMIDSPTISPTDLTSVPTFSTNNPTQFPSNTPILVTNNPTPTPTYKPTKSPSNTYTPSNTPTNTPTNEIYTTSGGHAAKESTENEFAKNLILFIVLGCVICLLMLIIFKLCGFYKKKRKINDEVIVEAMEMERIQSIQSISTTNMQTNVINTNTNVNTAETGPGTVNLVKWLTNLNLMEYHNIFVENGFGANSSQTNGEAV
eukprot:92984_1